MHNINVLEFLKRLYEMQDVVVTNVNKSIGTVEGGNFKTVGNCLDYKENIEILYEDESYLTIPKDKIQSIRFAEGRTRHGP